MTNKISVPIKGMHCKACEFLTEEQLSKLPGVKRVNADHSRACAELEYEGLKPSREQLVAALKKAGYDYGEDSQSDAQRVGNYRELAWAILLFGLGYWLIKVAGWDQLININTQSAMSPALILLIGLVAGVSSCMALVGGLVLSVAASYAKANPEMSAGQKIKPHVYFQIGRVGGYALLGAVLGWGGSWLQWSLTLSAWLIVLASLVMVVLGLKLSGLEVNGLMVRSTWMKKLFGRLDLKNRASRHYHPTKTVLLGAATFFVPCGFTQAMQVYALSSGSFYQGAMIMGLFALATVPGLLGLGLASAFIKGKWSGTFFKLIGLLLLAFAIFNLRNAWNLLQADGFTFGKANQIEQSQIPSNGSEQILHMVQDVQGYSPNKFQVELNRPVKWVIDSRSANSCSASIVAPKIGVKMQLKPGENIIRFTPKKVGTINFTCSMGMYRGTINVVEKKDGEESSSLGVGQVKAAAIEVESQKFAPEADKAPVTLTSEEQVKIFKTIYTRKQDIQPSEFTTKVGQKTRIEVLVKEGGKGCMRDIMIQGLVTEPQYLAEGETINLEFTPTKTGRYLIVCAMNIPRGVVVVE